MKRILLWSALIGATALPASILPAQAAPAAQHSFGVQDDHYSLDGKPFQIISGEVHPARIPPEYWENRLQMIKAMGCNTVSIYVFWNSIETQPGKWDFTGKNDIARFVRLAQKTGLWVILRPGPYVCAEWDLGGIPPYLLANRDVKLRTLDPKYMAASGEYLKRLAGQLAPLQITHGGPILMAQVENEYGSFGNSKEYMSAVRDQMKALFDIPLFTCDGPSQTMSAPITGVLHGINGADAKGTKEWTDKVSPGGPYISSEFYPGWFTQWGHNEGQRSDKSAADALDDLLKNDCSVNFYVVHGGSDFGMMNGANYGNGYAPQVTSYDYDAPIDEMGHPSSKFFALRTVIEKYTGQKAPEPPAVPPVITPTITVKRSASLTQMLGTPIKSEKPLLFEQMGVNVGYVLYRTEVAGGQTADLTLDEARDYVQIFLDGQPVAILDRRLGIKTIPLTVPAGKHRLDLLVGSDGHINYGGRLVDDWKGLTKTVTWGGQELTNWQMFPLPMTNVPKTHASAESMAPALYSGQFKLDAVGDVVLDMSKWSKGCVWVNGHNLGRYWAIGPQQSLYLPGAWLRKGNNSITIFETVRDGGETVPTLKEMVLNKLQPDTFTYRPPVPVLGAAALATQADFPESNEAQTVKWAPRKARYVALKTIKEWKNQDFASLAELDLLDENGQVLPRTGWKIAYVSSEETEAERAPASNILDGDPTTIWHTQYSGAQTTHPHVLILDLGTEKTISGARLLPRQKAANGLTNGLLQKAEFYLSSTPFEKK